MKLPAIVEKATLRGAMALPPAVFLRAFGQPPVNDRQTSLDAHVHVLLSLMRATQHPEIHTLGVEGARAVYDNGTAAMDVADDNEVIRVHTTLQGASGPLYARRYTTRDAKTGRPCIVFYHGGGFVVGTVEGYDGVCSLLAHRIGADVVSVEYCLAPENPFPDSIEDSVAAYRSVLNICHEWGCDPSRVAPMGDSAGANLAINISQRQVLDGQSLPAWQILIYPLTDHGEKHASRDRFGEGFFLTMNVMHWFARTYLGAALDADDQHDPRVVPMYFSRMKDMPPTYLVSAGFDPLRDECELYVKTLAEHGVKVHHRDETQLIHGFITMGGIIPAARHAIEGIADEIRALL